MSAYQNSDIKSSFIKSYWSLKHVTIVEDVIFDPRKPMWDHFIWKVFFQSILLKDYFREEVTSTCNKYLFLLKEALSEQ